MAKKTTPKSEPKETADPIAILVEQIDRIIQLKPGLQTKRFKAIKNELMKALE